MNMFSIAPSILAADFADLKGQIALAEAADVSLFHLDVMDGHFVPNISFGPCVIKSIRKVTSATLDVHLMISDPEKYVESFVKAGSDWITFHLEATNKPLELIRQIQSLGCKAGISIKPGTEVMDISSEVLAATDLVLIMTVEPGFGGQKFIHDAAIKIQQVRKRSADVIISVDGGIDVTTAPIAVGYGVNVLVAGSAIYGAEDPQAAIRSLQGLKK